MRYFIVGNPGSRSGRGARALAQCERLLNERGADFTRELTANLDDAETLARRAVDEGYGAVVAAGGDGTINRVASGLLAAVADGEKPPAFGVLYTGTSPDFCRFHGLPTEPTAAVAALLDGAARPIDVCRIKQHTAEGAARVAYFTSSANVGWGAGIAARSNRLRRYVGDFCGTLAAALVTIARCRPSACDLTIDGEAIALQRTLNITVGKNPHLASGLKLNVGARPDDGRLFVFAVRDVGRLAFLRALPKAYSGAIVGDPRFLLRWAQSVRVAPRQPRAQAEYDGDPAGYCPLEIDVLPCALNLLGGRS